MLNNIMWADIQIWVGITFLSVNIGWFDVILREQFFTRLLPGDMAAIEIGVQSIIILGICVIVLAEVVACLLIPALHRHVSGSLIVAAVFIRICLGNYFGQGFV